MRTIKVLPNASIKNAIINALEGIQPTKFSSVQFINQNSFHIKSTKGKIIEITDNKIRVGVKNGCWFVSEFKLIPAGEFAPRAFVGDYELLDEITMNIYGE